MRIFGPLPWPTISPVTVTPASVSASLVTVSPSTRSRAGRVTESPASPTRRLTVNRSPTGTLCCRPPAFTTAYTTELLDRLCRVLRAPGHRAPGAGRVARLPGHREVRGPGRCNPTSVPERRGTRGTWAGRGPSTSGGGQGVLFLGRGRTGRPAGGPAAARAGDRRRGPAAVVGHRRLGLPRRVLLPGVLHAVRRPGVGRFGVHR